MSGGEAVAAVVTTFNTNGSILANLQRIAGQVRVVIVVDDTGGAAQAPPVDYSGIENLVLIRNEQNLGISAALNRGVAQAAALGCDWVITLDDDTLVTESYIRDVFDFFRKGEVTSPGLIACSRGEADRVARGEEGEFKIKRTLITSGSVFSIQAYREVGGFDEGLFIDLVDFDFCTKLRKAGRSLVLLSKSGLAHRVGNSRKINLLGTSLVVYNHAPFRLYYQMRNVFFFAKKHFAFDPVLCVYLLLDVFRLPLKALLFEDQKRARFFYLAAGLFDGLRGRGGRLWFSLK